MDRERVAEVLEEIGFLLQLLGENPFKTRAYDNAARIIRGLDQDLLALVQRKELIRIKGIGSALAEKIAALVRHGELPYLEGLREQVPTGLLEWLKIPGMGAKKARAIHITLGISTLDELESACRDNLLRELPGFGETSEQKILSGISRLRQHAGRFLLSLAQSEAERLLLAVRQAPGVERAEIAGSVRRRLETVKDIDLVACAREPEQAMNAFAGVEGVLSISGRGPTKCSVRLASGLAADLRVVSGESFPFALLYFTGSKSHNISLRGRAQRQGLRLNEYALLHEEDGQARACASEEQIYRELGLRQWIPPELREDQGEIEAAEAGALPSLVEAGELQGLLHVHSSWSDGRASIADLVREARQMGLHYLAVCDHSQAAIYANGLTPERLRQQQQEIDQLNTSLQGEFRVLRGIEVDILHDGSLDMPDAALADLDLVIASVHSRFNLSEQEQTARMLRALDNPFVDVLGHLTGRLLLAREGYPLDVRRVLEAAAERGVAVEINAHPHRLELDWRHLRYGLRQGLKTCISPDAHSTHALHDFLFGVHVARKAWCTAQDVLNAWPLGRLVEHVQQRRARSVGR